MATERDPAGLVIFRFAFGLVLLASAARFVAKGWVEELYLAPAFHFTYYGFEWVRALPAWGMYALFGVMAAGALGIALGVATRWAAACFCAAFTYVELVDKTTYLNHYYFVSLMTLLLALVPSGGALSSLWSRAPEVRPVPALSYALLRFQTGVVYVFAGLAKLDADWLLRAEPLTSWSYGLADWPVVGAWLQRPELPYALSWAGAAFDLSIVPLLVWGRTRAVAYGAAVAFHGLVGWLFPIGVFSWVMLASATLFFAPSWPRRFLGFTPALSALPARSTPSTLVRALAAAYVAVQVAVPLRFLAYPGAVNWTEEAFRFSWRVMLTEKSGSVEYEVLCSAPAARFVVRPREELTAFQYRMLSTQPDMIHEYALELAGRYRRRGFQGVRVHAHAFASLNGRPSQRLIDPEVDLAREARSLAPKPWIVPLCDRSAQYAFW